jgi:hypothetical protein
MPEARERREFPPRRVSVAFVRPAYFAFSDPTSDAFFSSRKPRKTGWRNRLSLVHSVNFTSQTTLGLTQTHRFISAAVNPGSRPRPVAGRRFPNAGSFFSLLHFLGPTATPFLLLFFQNFLELSSRFTKISFPKNGKLWPGTKILKTDVPNHRGRIDKTYW